MMVSVSIHDVSHCALSHTLPSLLFLPFQPGSPSAPLPPCPEGVDGLEGLPDDEFDAFMRELLE